MLKLLPMAVALAASGAALAACERKPVTTPTVQVAAASDLTLAFQELGRLYRQQSGVDVNFAFGSSGLLARQLAEGAPFDLFASANIGFVEQVVQRGACEGTTKAPYAQGRLALWWPENGNGPKDLVDLRDARFKRIAIANPEHAPYGEAARAALQKLGIWDDVLPRLVYGENVRQTLQFAQTGNAEAALVAGSLLTQADQGHSFLVDASLHAPIVQALVVCRNGKNSDGARQFVEFLRSAAARAVLRRYGFEPPP